jgi:hypothetical protein
MIVPKWMERQQAYAQATGQKYADLFELLEEAAGWWLDEPEMRFKFKAGGRKRS